MKVKIRLKIDEKRQKSIAAYRRIIVGEIKPFPDKGFLPNSIKDNFFFIEGKNFYVDQPREIAETIQEESKEMLIPIKEVRSMTVLPEDFDLENIQYEVVGSRLICKTTKQEIPIQEEGETI
ncbi:MAG: hypothetical protein PHW62_07870 [Candidatus Ratteibacteria bacterium]|nr:hypothetical protein [Candidatus Ratteibacteria bacterium]